MNKYVLWKACVMLQGCHIGEGAKYRDSLSSLKMRTCSKVHIERSNIPGLAKELAWGEKVVECIIVALWSLSCGKKPRCYVAFAAVQHGGIPVMQACGCGPEDSGGAVYSGVGGCRAAIWPAHGWPAQERASESSPGAELTLLILHPFVLSPDCKF